MHLIETVNGTSSTEAADAWLFSSESVSAGHPDKLADQISDAVLDHLLARDPLARVACETLVAGDLVVVAGEFGAREEALADLESEVPRIARAVLREAGYGGRFPGIDPDSCEVVLRLNRQSEDIHRGVARGDGRVGAGDQGLVFGHACTDTVEFLPQPIALAHRLLREHARVRALGLLPWLGPDAKSQVTLRYGEGLERFGRVATVVLSSQHVEDVDADLLINSIREHVVAPALAGSLKTEDFRVLINPTGRFVLGGPAADVGLTGRKIVVDTYGGAAPHGGGAFSGKDPTKVDRSAAYAARHVAKNIVAAGLAARCTVQVAYAIGEADPVSLHIDTHGTGACRTSHLLEAVKRHLDLSPGGIIERLDLRRPIYRQTAVYGHFGRSEPDFTWELTDLADTLRTELGN